MSGYLNPRGLFNLVFSADKHLSLRLFTLLGFLPRKISLYRLAFSHKSNTNTPIDKTKIHIGNNERLEYLGDAILGSIVAEYLYNKYPHGDEGFLTKMRSKIVMRKSLNSIADRMGLDVFLDNYNNTKISGSMLGNALEALVGAIYMDLGYKRTKRIVINRILRSYLDIHHLENRHHNYKSLLLEHCQKNGYEVSYELLQRYKQDKRDKFQIAVKVDGEELAIADDFNKKSAEQAASEQAMKVLGIIQQKKSDHELKAY